LDCISESSHASEDLRGKGENKTKETGSIRREKEKTRYSPIMKMGMVKEKGERLFISEVYSVAICTSSQKNVIMRCVRYVAWKPNDSGRVCRRDEA
jgi:hypothetical protein